MGGDRRARGDGGGERMVEERKEKNKVERGGGVERVLERNGERGEREYDGPGDHTPLLYSPPTATLYSPPCR